MLPKPKTCEGCPLAGDMQGFVPDELVEDAPVLVLAQAPGADEEAGMKVVGHEYAGRRRVPELSKIRALLGNQSRYRLDDIIREVVEWKWQPSG